MVSQFVIPPGIIFVDKFTGHGKKEEKKIE